MRAKILSRGVLATLLGLLVALVVVPATARAADGTNMYRLYNRWSGEHFYTASTLERDSLAMIGWSYEGVGWVAPTTGDPVYRLFNRYTSDHHYVMDAGERDKLVALGWRAEGIGWYSGGDVEVLRQFNPYVKTATHNYTTSQGENDSLVGMGWKEEGVGWYALADGRPALPEDNVPEPSVPEESEPAPAPSNPAPSQPSSPAPSEPQTSVVYWTPNGEVYHSTRDCPSLRRSKTVLSGTLSEASAAGKDRPCKNCY